MTDFLRQFRSRRLLCGTLADFAARQRELAEAGDDAGLAELLARKGRLLDRLAAEGGAEAAAEWRGVRDFLDPDTRAECERLLDECRDALASVQDDDARAVAAAQARRDATAARLKEADASERTAAGYQQAAPKARPRLNLVG